MNNLTQVVMLVAAFTTVVQSSVIRRSTIDNPCRIEGTTTGGTFQALDGQIRDTITAARTADAMCEALKRALVQGNYLMASEISALDARPINITGLTAEYTDANMNQANKITHLKEDYTVISKHLLYIENATCIARLHDKVQKSLANVSHSMRILHCKVDTALRSQEGSSTDRPTPSMAQTGCAADTKDCSQYLYTLAKTTQKFLRYVITKYENFENTNQ